jgi:hypothetical protein
MRLVPLKTIDTLEVSGSHLQFKATIVPSFNKHLLVVIYTKIKL